jgi:hypothetical protein
MLKDIIEDTKAEARKMFPSLQVYELDAIVEETAQIVAREVLRKVREQLNTFEVYDDEADNCRRFKSEALFHLQSLEEELSEVLSK